MSQSVPYGARSVQLVGRICVPSSQNLHEDLVQQLPFMGLQRVTPDQCLKLWNKFLAARVELNHMPYR